MSAARVGGGERKLLRCACPGMPIFPGAPCPDAVSQEDGLCDHCRRMDCRTITTWSEQARRQQAEFVRVGLVMRDAF